jgi:hypothetical protein
MFVMWRIFRANRQGAMGCWRNLYNELAQYIADRIYYTFHVLVRKSGEKARKTRKYMDDLKTDLEENGVKGTD